MARLFGGTSPVLLLLCGLVLASANLYQFGVMVQHLTKRNSLSYNGYGCYCGWGGSKQPVDDTDWCCQVHDCCYTVQERRQCWPKLELYNYTLTEEDIICGGRTKCQRDTCECDRAAAHCFRRATFQVRYKHYKKSYCQGDSPPCPDALRHLKLGSAGPSQLQMPAGPRNRQSPDGAFSLGQ